MIKSILSLRGILLWPSNLNTEEAPDATQIINVERYYEIPPYLFNDRCVISGDNNIIHINRDNNALSLMPTIDEISMI